MKNKSKKRQKGKHLGLAERVEIYRLREAGYSGRAIAKEIGRHQSVINRELKRNSKPFSKEYKPIKAHEIAQKRSIKQRKQAPLKNVKVLLYVRTKLRQKWTPEQIAGRLSKDLPGESISFETIYQYIYGIGRQDKLWRYLPRHHKKRKRKKSYYSSKKKTSRIKNTVSIDKRGTKANNRKQVGHWETDLMESNRGINTNVSVHVERKTRYTKLKKQINKKANIKQKNMEKTFKMLKSISKTKKPIVKTFTYDNGSENANHYQLNKKLKTKSYFCHPYHSWEKGSVENVIGRVRRFIPKGTDLSKTDEKYLQQVENWINNAPLKCLNWSTPNEAMEQEANKYKFRSYKKKLDQSGAFPN